MVALEQLPLFPTEKRCTKCRLIKPIEDFSPSGPLRYRGRCKPCHCADMKIAQRDKRARARAVRIEAAAEHGAWPAPRTTKRCARCNEDKPLNAFNCCAKGPLGRHAYCRDCAHNYKMEAKARRAEAVLTERQQLRAAGLKRCSGCQQGKPLESFSRQGRWHFYLCNECRRARRRSPKQAERLAARAEAARLCQQGLKRCNLCQQAKQVSAFGAHRFTADGLNWWCTACNVANATAYYAANTEARIAYTHAYRGRNKDKVIVYALNRRARMRQAGGRLSVDEITLLYDVQRGRCAYCLTELGTSFHRDHMTPLGPSGPNAIHNIALTCSRCNCRKHTRSAGQWLAVLLQEARRARAQAVV